MDNYLIRSFTLAKILSYIGLISFKIEIDSDVKILWIALIYISTYFYKTL